LKKGLASDDVLAAAVEVMTELNEAGARAAQAAGAHGMTDVTGFGLLGHLHELALASGVSAVIEADAVPVIAGVVELLADDRAIAGGSRNNRRYAEEFASFEAGVDEVRRRLVTDAMTSGGLLVALDPGRAGEVPGWLVGRLVEGEPGTITVV
jgi:selenide,water dikinase